MKIKLFLFLLLLTFAPSAFSQESSSENKPKAYLFSGGDSGRLTRPAENSAQSSLQIGGNETAKPTQMPQAFLVSGGDISAASTRPRVVKNYPENPISKVKTDFSLEKQAFALINEQRAKLNLEPLVWSEDVAKIARLHSENMANFSFFSHKGIDGLMVNDRADECGVKKWQAIGENIAYNKGFENPVAFAVDRWMQSPAHRENLLNSRWKESGIGIAITGDGTYYFTEVFLMRK